MRICSGLPPTVRWLSFWASLCVERPLATWPTERALTNTWIFARLLLLVFCRSPPDHLGARVSAKTWICAQPLFAILPRERPPGQMAGGACAREDQDLCPASFCESSAGTPPPATWPGGPAKIKIGARFFLLAFLREGPPWPNNGGTWLRKP